MSRDYIPSREGNLRSWLNNFAEKLPSQAADLGVTPEEVEEVKADARALNYASDVREQITRKDRQWSAYMMLFKSGSGENNIPLPSVVAEPPASVPAGFLDRTRRLVTRIKAHRKYTVAIGKDLGVVGGRVSPLLNSETLQPELKVQLESGRPVVTWKRNGSDALELECDRGSGVFERIAVLLGVRYVDYAPLPDGKIGVRWHYRGTYRRKDELVGQSSNTVSIGVFGQTEAAA
jgi:hypothetical protein